MGVGVGGIGDGSNGSRGSSLHLNLGGCGNNGGSNGLHVDVGLCDIASDVMDVSLSCRGRSVSNITCGIVDIGESLRGLSALLRDGAGKSQGNGRQENEELHVGESRTGTLPYVHDATGDVAD